jgi:hypothetical protein
MADFLTELKKLYKLENELGELEKSRANAYSAAGQAIAAKQAEVTTQKKAVQAAANA